MNAHADAFRTISEVAEDLDLPQHVLRFWETRFTQIRPLKRGGGRRYYRPEDVELLRAIRHLLYGEGYTIRGVQRILKEQGIKAVISLRPEGAALSSPRPSASRDEDEDDGGDFAEETEDSAVVTPQAAERLQRVLSELAECARILEAARTT
jgi:DNA-binding transcriptional MerR regulator